MKACSLMFQASVVAQITVVYYISAVGLSAEISQGRGGGAG